MALEKTISYRGAALTYHKITSNTQDAVSNSTRVIVASYVSEEARQSDIKSILMTTARTVAGVDHDRAALYAALKLDQLFEGAADA